MNKKIILMVLAISVLAVAICHAADRWQWVASDDKVGIFFDTQTIKYDNDKSHVIVYVKYVFNDDARAYFAKVYPDDILCKTKYGMIKTEYDLNYRQVRLSSMSYYGQDNSVLKTINNDNAKYEEVFPDTRVEKVMKAVQIYLKDNIAN